MRKRPILVVDDNHDACAMMARLLSAFGYQTDAAYDASGALKLVQQTEYGIAIIDYLMPGLNGVELFRQMRKIRPELPGVFLTGHTTINVVYPAIEAGILRVLPKPANFEELLPIIDEHLGSAA